MISIIIPVLNEEKALPSCLQSIKKQQGDFELIVVDGGSDDRSIQIARDNGATVLESEPGRSKQLNKGAEASKGDILFFVHADSKIPEDALSKIRGLIKKGYDGGAFSLRFEPSNIFLAFTVFWSNLFMAVFRDFQGDRGIFVRRDLFEKLEGFKDMELMEDVDFSVRMRKSGFRTRQLWGPIITSSRRFENMGVITVTYWTIRLLIEYHLGKDLNKTAKKFYSARKR